MTGSWVTLGLCAQFQCNHQVRVFLTLNFLEGILPTTRQVSSPQISLEENIDQTGYQRWTFYVSHPFLFCGLFGYIFGEDMGAEAEVNHTKGFY